MNALDGLKVVVTRPRHQSVSLSSALQSHGAQVIEFPTIEIKTLSDWADPGTLEAFDWAVFTSGNAVTAFCDGLTRHSRRIDSLQSTSICAIGPGTKRALDALELRVQLLPTESIAESVLDALQGQSGSLHGKRILLPQGAIARPFLLKELQALGADVIAPVVYETICANPSEAERDALVIAKPDLVTFTSASTAENFQQILGRDRISKLNCSYASIGPQTSAAATRLGIAVEIQPDRYDIPALIDAIVVWKVRRGI